ncbi:MAG: hypothetical protein HSCHL_2664 [Hydrogenibacillus schlegelii]|uniref:Uncharacterized protein n=1 Tax=Hydrogenibacillus schlegelii TaxID=1484 RepID=A0A2T5G3K4_HYDSH|nr:MAG: hypothetical protein HSCHL_2664 [Hydrogenibacillus schlegelii]
MGEVAERLKELLFEKAGKIEVEITPQLETLTGGVREGRIIRRVFWP